MGHIRSRVARILFAVILLAALAPRGTLAGPPAGLESRLDALLAKAARAQLALVVQPANAAEPWYARQGDVPLKPASVLKLFTTAAALQRFGPQFAFQTELYLSGDELWVRGGGDPGLGDERLDEKHGRTLDGLLNEWAKAVTQRGVSRLSRLVLDDHVFDHEFRHPDWPGNQENRWYQAPVGGLNLNGNCLDAALRVKGGQIELSLRPDLPEDFLQRALKVGGKHQVRLFRPADADVFQLTGTVSRNEEFAPVAVGDPTATSGHALKQALRRAGVTVDGPVVRRRLKPEALAGAERIAVHRTSLEEVLWRANTFSQNLFAECLLKSLAAYQADGSRSEEAGSWPGGARVLRSELERLGVVLEGARFSDGSGLSHENRVTARQVVGVLRAMLDSAQARTYVESLAQPGRPGTMKSQYSDARLSGRLRGKTGTLAGVRSLAGYFEVAPGEVVAFALLINGEAPDALPLNVCRALAEAGGR